MAKTDIKNLNYEINDLVIIYRNTNEEKYFNELAEKVRRLVILIAKEYEYSIPKSELEDLVSEGYIVLLRVIENYDQYKGYKFSTLIRKYIIQQYNRIYKKATRHKRFNGAVPDSVERITEICKDGELDSHSFTVDCEDFKDAEFRQVLESLDLTVNERVIVKVIMGGGNKKDCSRALDISQPSVTYYIRHLREKFILAGYVV